MWGAGMISVIVPVYNVEKYLPQCIDSILAQTYTDFELIIVDDGSTDRSGQICDEYKDKDSRVYVVHQENRGVSAARNVGIDMAKGEYIAFVDSDDYVSGEYLEKLYNCLACNNADISICGMLSFFDGKKLDSDLVESIKKDRTVMTGREACLSIYKMDGRVSVMPWGKMYKASLFDNIRYPIGLIYEDDATTPRLFYKAKNVAMFADALYFYRNREDSITNTSFSAKKFDGVKAVDICIDFFSEKNDCEMCKFARTAKKVMQAKIVIKAYAANMKSKIPNEYKISEIKALKTIYKYASNNTYMWYLSLIHPKWVKPHSYWVKIKEILHLS